MLNKNNNGVIRAVSPCQQGEQNRCVCTHAARWVAGSKADLQRLQEVVSDLVVVGDRVDVLGGDVTLATKQLNSADD